MTKCTKQCKGYYDGKEGWELCRRYAPDSPGSKDEQPWLSGCLWSRSKDVDGLALVVPGDRCRLSQDEQDEVTKWQQKIRDCEIEGMVVCVPWMDE